MPPGTLRRPRLRWAAAAAALAACTAAVLVASAPASGASAAKCRTPQLSAKLGQSSGAAGTIVFSVVLRNKSSATCTLKGYAKLRILDAAGALPTRVRHGGLAFLERPVARVTLRPGKRATILVAYEDVPVGNETTCPTGTALAVTPPHDSGVLRVSVTTTACGGGRLWESPVLAGVVSPA